MVDNCPKCDVSLIGNPIPEASREWFGWKTHFRREIGIVENDYVTRWVCPDCGHEWPREGVRQVKQET